MPSPSPYGPDRSLLAASIVLVGGLLLAAGAVYLVSDLTTGGPRWHAGVQMPNRSWNAASPRSARRAPSPGVRRPGSALPPLVGGGTPAWAGQSQSPQLGSSTGRYDLNPDFGHADLGSMSTSGSGERRASGRVSQGGPSMAARSPTVDLGRSSTPGDGESGAAWRSELSRLDGQMRALSGALAALDRSEGSHSQGTEATRSGKQGGTTSSGVVTSSRDVPTPPDPVPVDGGLGWLAAAGAVYAARRLQQRRTGED